METQGWPLYAARKDGRVVYAVIGWEWRGSTADPRAGRRAVVVEIGAELDGPQAVELGDAVVFTPDIRQAISISGIAPSTYLNGELAKAARRAQDIL